MMNRVACALCLLVAVVVAGCGGAQTEGRVQIASQPMPPGGNWDGVYQSPAYGRMEFTVSGSTVKGLYEGERHFGVIEGTIDGNVLHFQWTQWNQDLQGKQRSRSGNGYFRYVQEEEQTSHGPRLATRIEGEWGYDGDNAGNHWKAVKLNDRTRKTLQPHDVGGTRTTLEEDYSQSAGFDTSAGETDVNMDPGKMPETKKVEVEKDKPAEGIDNLF